MILVRLMGGLGNQMFQYAAARRLAHFHNTEVKLDLSFLENPPPTDTPRSLELQHTFAKAVPATRYEMMLFAGRTDAVLTKMLRMVSPRRPRPRLFKEPHFHFAPEALDLADNSYLVGYWQSQRYFADIAEIIQREFAVNHPLQGKNLELSRLIGAGESVSVHVRRGDYVTNQKAVKFHAVCGLDYYRKCVSEIAGKVPDPHFFIFSDDPAWVRDNLALKHKTTIIDHNDPKHGYEDLRLMSLCRHNIIANSSFSWWGAWLNSNPGKIVMAPARWLINPEIDTKDLLPESWQKVAA